MLRQLVAGAVVAITLSGVVVAGPLDDGVAAYKMGDYVTSLKLLKPLADKGDADARTYLGTMYELGQGVTQDYAEAMKWYRLAASQGNSDSQFSLGFMYQVGEGVPTDGTEAAKWYWLAANQGDAYAQHNLGGLYARGMVVAQSTQDDYAEAMKWYRLAANQGDADSQFSLGNMYANGEGVPKDSVLAQMWFNLAAAQGYADAIRNRDLTGAGLTPSQLAEAQRLAREWKPTVMQVAAAGQIAQPVASSSGSTARATTMQVPSTTGPAITVQSFMPEQGGGAKVPTPGFYYLFGLNDPQAPYQIWYTGGAFNISLLREPVGKYRREAEIELVRQLRITETEACRLKDYSVGTPFRVNSTYSGINLKFSFCAGAVALPGSSVVASATPLAPATEQDRRFCDGYDAALPDQRIMGCTAIIVAGKDTPQIISLAYRFRADAYEAKGQYSDALFSLDQSIKFDPPNPNVWNARCWVRAIVRNFDGALSDCNESLRLRPNDAGTLDSRGFAYLGSGQLDKSIADYAAALKLAPKLALSLYGRGTARIKNGDRTGGNSDIAAAKAIDPTIGDRFDRLTRGEAEYPSVALDLTPLAQAVTCDRKWEGDAQSESRSLVAPGAPSPQIPAIGVKITVAALDRSLFQSNAFLLGILDQIKSWSTAFCQRELAAGRLPLAKVPDTFLVEIQAQGGSGGYAYAFQGQETSGQRRKITEWVVWSNSLGVKWQEDNAQFEREQARIKAEQDARTQAQLALARAAQARDNARQSFTSQYRVDQFVGVQQLSANPFLFTGKTVAVQLKFVRMISANEAVFSWSPDVFTNYLFIITGVPSTAFASANQIFVIAMKPGGTKDTTALGGGNITLPYGQFVGAHACSQSDCGDILG